MLAPERRKRVAAIASGMTPPAEPWFVEYARSFFPVFLIVLLLRSFIVEPFRIPSASMMPTLLIGDFILVNKYDYGIRLPVINLKIIENKIPAHGDIVVFRYPEDPSIPFIKRIVGVPGDHVVYKDKAIYINGVQQEQQENGAYEGTGAGIIADGDLWFNEKFNDNPHQILIAESGRAGRDFEVNVPEGKYFVLGENIDSFEARVQKFKNNILSDEAWTKAIAEKAKQNKVPLDTMIMRDARYMAEMEYSGGN
jgi:signal peptidase I